MSASNTRAIIEEFAKLFSDQDSARELLVDAGIPTHRLKDFSGMVPFHYWRHVWRELDKGLVRNGHHRLVAAAAAYYPGNQLLLTASAGLLDAETPLPPPPPAQRDALVEALSACRALDSDTARRVVQQLPADIRDTVGRAAAPTFAPEALVDSCTQLPRGLHHLGRAVRRIEGDSLAMRTLGRHILRLTLTEALMDTFRDDPAGLRFFVAMNLGSDAARSMTGPTELDALALAAAEAAEASQRLDLAFISQIMERVPPEQATHGYLQDIVDTWLPYAQRPAAQAHAPEPTAAVEHVGEHATEHANRPPPTVDPILPVPQPRRSSPPAAGPPTRLSLILDRWRQWATLTYLCSHSREHVAFLIHGHQSQSLRLFTGRVLDYLSQDCRPVHRVYQIPFRSQYTVADTAEIWAANSRRTLGMGHELDLGRVLAQTARHEPIMLILGNGVLADLQPLERDALLQFIGRDLPAAIGRGAPEHPVRVLLPVEYPEPEASDSDLLSAIRQTLRASPDLKFAELLTVAFPPWHEVEQTLREELGDASDDFLARARTLYDQRMNSQPGPTFADLTHALSQLVDEHTN